jgi:enoyl-CoA hydratase
LSVEQRLVVVERHGRVALVRLSRPDVLNALSLKMRAALREEMRVLEADEGVGAIVITGNDEAFAAGADVKMLKDWSKLDAVMSPDLRSAWEQVVRCKKPVVAAVAGFALGAGCELAMMCDFIIAADNAKFGQPEIKLATIPGSGGTQRLTRLVGKSKAMEMILTGRVMDAVEAERCGLVSRVVPLAALIEEALKTATYIAGLSAPAVALAKEAVNRALETSLAEGLHQEARLFEATFSLQDRREGMTAFLERRKPNFTNR